MVVFLHAGGTTSQMWESVTTRLPELHCLSVDLPGYGESRDIPWLSFETSARAVSQLVDHEAPTENVHLVGLSLGAYVGLVMLSHTPRRFDSAVLSGFHAGGVPNRLLLKCAVVAMAPFARMPFLARRTARMLGGDAIDVEHYVAQAATIRPAAFRRSTLEAVDFEAPPNLEDIATQTLVMAGAREHPLIIKSLKVFAERMPDCSAARVAGGGHGWVIRQPELFARTVRVHVLGEALPTELLSIDD